METAGRRRWLRARVPSTAARRSHTRGADSRPPQHGDARHRRRWRAHDGPFRKAVQAVRRHRCQRRHARGVPQALRQLAGQRELRALGCHEDAQFHDGEFDVVMFSYNGLDCLDPESRLVALREISRVLKPGGVFIFSAHNTRALPKRMSLTRHFTLHPLNLLRGIKSWVQLNYIYNSPAKLKRALAAPFCTVHDGSYRFAYEPYYIKPEAQLEQLVPYFQVERVLELSRRGAARRKGAGDDGLEVGVLLLQEAGLGRAISSRASCLSRAGRRPRAAAAPWCRRASPNRSSRCTSADTTARAARSAARPHRSPSTHARCTSATSPTRGAAARWQPSFPVR